MGVSVAVGVGGGVAAAHAARAGISVGRIARGVGVAVRVVLGRAIRTAVGEAASLALPARLLTVAPDLAISTLGARQGLTVPGSAAAGSLLRVGGEGVGGDVVEGQHGLRM